MKRFTATFGLASATQYLILANVIVYGIQILNQPGGDSGAPLSALSIHAITWVENNFALITPPQVPQVFWQLISYMFLHGAWWHILFNMYVLWMFGHILERVWGFRRFMHYYFFTGIGAGLTTVVAALMTGGGPSVNLGASGAIMGLLLAFGVLFPNQRIYLIFPPVPGGIPAKYLVIGLAVLSVFFTLTGAFPGIGHITHLGGLIFGLLFLKGRGWLLRLLR